ncbi:Calpain-14, partial [Eschrichtius robustus]|nr:Calpain-14 [Eschrichtius robustus]
MQTLRSVHACPADSCGDCVLSGLGDCWFLAALQALTLHQDILSRVIPLNQSFTEKYAGIFRFWVSVLLVFQPGGGHRKEGSGRVMSSLPGLTVLHGSLHSPAGTLSFQFWHFGKWVPVVADDRLPVSEAGQLVFVSSTYKNLFWGALLEKAYAKLSGSYEDLQCEQVSEALVDFTGGLTMTINLAEAPGKLWDILTRATYSRTQIGLQTHSRKERALKNGLVPGHAYTLTGIRKSRGMALQDFKAHFMLLVICKLSPGLLSQEVGQKWSYTMLEGRWEKGTTAGGPKKSPLDTFWKNPQFLLLVWRPQEGRKFQMPCSMLVSLLQKPRHRHRNKKPHLAIGFYLFRMSKSYDDQRRLPPKSFWKNAPLNWPETFLREKEVSRELWLEPGTYVIVPCTSESRQESEFVLRVLCRKHVF